MSHHHHHDHDDERPKYVPKPGEEFEGGDAISQFYVYVRVTLLPTH